jgi:hypothetical protein
MKQNHQADKVQRAGCGSREMQSLSLCPRRFVQTISAARDLISESLPPPKPYPAEGLKKKRTISALASGPCGSV